MLVSTGAELDRHMRGAGGQDRGARAGGDGQCGQRALPAPLPPRICRHRRRPSQPRIQVLHGGPTHLPLFSLSHTPLPGLAACHFPRPAQNSFVPCLTLNFTVTLHTLAGLDAGQYSALLATIPGALSFTAETL